ncbi:hypothetical protein AB0F88_19165 [Streptosporangium sp. NPDC023963]|uniref:hypothetical protein n=1 Tax=Streptosporangium sp. NPDC023963 TaxID=3155608 RepID=UPI003437A64E
MSVGLSGAVLLALAPLTGSSAAGATVRVMSVNPDPSQIEGCDVDPAGPCEEPTPIVTVTVTEDPQGGVPEETAVPQKTVTTTITVPASPKPPKPPKTSSAPPPPPQETAVQPPPVQNTMPPVTPPADTASPENNDPQFPPTNPEPTPLPTASPTPSDTATLDESAAGTSVYEIRNAGSEFDGATLSRQLGIPALILVLLVLFAVLIFEGRLRRLAHAAAIRRAGPRGMGRDPMEPMAYPGGPGYGPGPYQGGTAYAPIISFVPMQMYAPVYPEGYTPERYPHGYDQTTAYLPAPGYEQQPVAGHSDSHDLHDPYDPQTGHVQPGRPAQASYGPTAQDGSPAAFQSTSRFDSGEGRLPQGAPEFPGAPFPQEPARGDLAADGPRDDFRPFGTGPAPVPQDVSGQGPSTGRPLPGGPRDGFTPSGGEPQGDRSGPERPAGETAKPFGPEPRGGPAQGPAETGPGDRPAGDERPPAEPTPTAVYPLPGQDTGKKKRGLFRRST